MQILLVEDDRSLASGLRHALHKQGYVVNHVESGEAALYVISTEPPDIQSWTLVYPISTVLTF